MSDRIGPDDGSDGVPNRPTSPGEPTAEEPKRRSPLYAVLGAVLVAVGGMAGAALFGGVTFVVISALGVPLSPVGSFGLSFIAGSAGFVSVSYLYLRRRVADPVGYVGIAVPSLRELVWVVGGYVGAMSLVVIAAMILTLIQVDPETTNQAAQAGLERPALLLWLVPLSFFVIAPGEEILFRGTVQRRLREAFPAWTAIPLTAALFALLHFFSLTGGAGGRFVAIGVLFLPSLVFGTIYEYTDNIVVPILVHGAYNSTLVLLVYLTIQMGSAEELAVLL
ncbi:MAG: CPBP family intramembrane glutamic endopeptidase [Halanaeroarchaeum sp.]